MKWIDVNKKMPTRLQDVLVWYTAPLTFSHVRSACYMGENCFSTSGIQTEKPTITHWMPQPEAPEERPIWRTVEYILNGVTRRGMYIRDIKHTKRHKGAQMSLVLFKGNKRPTKVRAVYLLFID